MKNLFAIAFATTLTFGMISCGPSDVEKKIDSLQNDSTAKEMGNTADSMIAAMERQNDSTTKAEKTKAVADSTRKADSLAHLKKK